VPEFDAARAKEIADGSATAMSELAVMRAETDHKILALLTPEQRRMVDERGPHRRRPGGDRPAPPPPER
jgi:Spy/CpxP family protein refolding chaperone